MVAVGPPGRDRGRAGHRRLRSLRLGRALRRIGRAINEGVLFRVEAAVALVAAVAVIAIGRRVCYLAALAVAGSALAAMLVSRYVDLGQLGPFPDFYDPVWFPEKLFAAFAEGAACVTALAGAIIIIRPGKKSPPMAGPRQRRPAGKSSESTGGTAP